jgi:hypothetical protein
VTQHGPAVDNFNSALFQMADQDTGVPARAHDKTAGPAKTATNAKGSSDLRRPAMPRPRTVRRPVLLVPTPDQTSDVDHLSPDVFTQLGGRQHD